MACVDLTSCMNLYPTYDLTAPNGVRGTLCEKLALIKTYTLTLQDGTTYSVELNPVASMVSTKYTVNKGGETLATLQKEMGGCSLHGRGPGLSTCFKMCVKDGCSVQDLNMVAGVGIAVDQNHK